MTPPRENERALRRVADARRLLDRAESDYVLALHAARTAGATNGQIAAAAQRSAATIAKRLGSR